MTMENYKKDEMDEDQQKKYCYIPNKFTDEEYNYEINH